MNFYEKFILIKSIDFKKNKILFCLVYNIIIGIKFNKKTFLLPNIKFLRFKLPISNLKSI